MIRLRCQNPDCQYCYEITEKELLDNPQYHKQCLMCGSQITVANLDEIVSKDLDRRADEYLQSWINTLGAEGALELVERSPKNKVRDMYMEKLKKRGFKLKG